MPEPAAEPASEGAADVEAAEHARYAFRATARGLEARSAEHGFALVARARGLTITQQERELSLRTTRIGRPGRLEVLAAPTLRAAGARVELASGSAVEWFENGPRGVEHGVDIAERPAGEGVVEVEVEARGALRPVLVGTAIELQDAEGTPRVRYADLVVRDAADRRLPAQVAVRGDTIVLRFADAEARYPVVVDPLITTDVAELTASDAAAGDEFGGTPFETSGGPTVAVSGTTAAVAAPWNDGGAVYVYVQAAGGGGWTQQARIAPPAGLPAGARFGYSIALAGDRLVIGAPLSGAGRVFVFARSGTTWSQEAELVAPGITTGEHFGVAVATDGNSVIVGARYDDDGARPGGSAHVFVRSGTTWTHQARLHASDQAFGDDFGSAVAIDGGTALVGALFHGAPELRGAAYAFVRSGTTWAQQAKLVATDGAALDQLGRSVALDGDVAVVGAPQHQIAEFSDGAAYVFTRSGTSWSQTARLGAWPLSSPGDQLGYSVAIDGRVIAAGARFDDTRELDAGAVTLYERLNGVWTVMGKHVAPDAAAGDRFGDSVALGSGTLAVGAPFTDGGGANAGSAYLVSVAVVGQSNGWTCTDTEDCASGHCVDGVCCDSACGGGATDCQACSFAAGGTTDGTCGPLRSGVAQFRLCRASAGDCDVPEACTPTSMACPADTHRPAGTSCRSSVGTCDVAEVCDGTSVACPADARHPSGTECRASAGACDVAEVCDGTSVACPADARRASGTECRASAGACDVAEACDGASTTCPVDLYAADGTSCTDGAVCNGDEICELGECRAGSTLDCDDGDECTADSCAEPAGCAHDPIAGCCHEDLDCDDGDPCTTDRCDGSRCANDVIAGCGDAGVDPDAGVDVDAGSELDAGVGIDASIELDAGIDHDAAVDHDAGFDDDAAADDDAAVDDDGGVIERDASTADGGDAVDAGDTAPPSDGGCSCRAAGTGEGSRGPWALALGCLAIAWARRRRALRA